MFFDARLLKLNLNPFAAFNRKKRQRVQEQCKSTDAKCCPCLCRLLCSVRKYISQQEGSHAVLGEVQFFEHPFLKHFLRISLSSQVLPFSFHAG
jgi:hypothetical protein